MYNVSSTRKIVSSYNPPKLNLYRPLCKILPMIINIIHEKGKFSNLPYTFHAVCYVRVFAIEPLYTLTLQLFSCYSATFTVPFIWKPKSIDTLYSVDVYTLYAMIVSRTLPTCTHIR